jgi:hypothetical protein
LTECNWNNRRVAGGLSDPSWWPTPPPRPAPSASKLVTGFIVPVVVAAGLVLVLTALGRSGNHAQSPSAAAPAAQHVPAVKSAPSAQARFRETFRECVRSAGGGGTASPFRSRFGGGPSTRLREAYAICRSVLDPHAVAPAPATRAPAPPVA